MTLCALKRTSVLVCAVLATNVVSGIESMKLMGNNGFR